MLESWPAPMNSPENSMSVADSPITDEARTQHGDSRSCDSSARLLRPIPRRCSQHLEHFWHADSYLAYRRKWGVTCVLADPVGPAR